MDKYLEKRNGGEVIMAGSVEALEKEVESLREDLDKMMMCANVIKQLVEKFTGKNIDKLIEKEMKKMGKDEK